MIQKQGKYDISLRKRQLRQIALRKFSIKFPEDDTDMGDVDLKLAVSSNILSADEEKGEYVLRVSVDLETENENAYSISVVADGKFSIDPEAAVNAKASRVDIETNGMVDVYEAISGYIEAMTANSNQPMLRLPSINVSKIEN